MPEPQVQTASGRIEGRRASGISSFLGVPYAAPPTSNLRFRPPQPPMPWTGVAPANEFGKIAMQLVGGGPRPLAAGPTFWPTRTA